MIRRVLPLFFLLCCLSPAQAAEPLFVSTVKVDVMGENAEDARELAISKAKRDALEDLFDKFVPSQKAILMNSLKDDQIDAMTRKVRFDDELIDGNRFRANATVSFSAGQFNKAIADQIKAVESDKELLTTASLILPIFDTSDRMYLFETVNPWGVAWQNVARNIGRGQLITPYGDSIDYSLISAKDALNGEYKTFEPLVRRYGVRDVVILKASLKTETSADEGNPNAKPVQVLEVHERRVQAMQDEVKILEYVADTAETKEELMARAARDIGIYVMNMQQDTVSEVSYKNKKLDSVTALVPITTMQRFYDIRDKLKTVPGVELLQVLAVRPRQADIQLQFTGERSVLIEAIIASGLHVTDQTHYLEIYP